MLDVRVVISPWLRHGDVCVVDGQVVGHCIHCVEDWVRLEMRREDAIAAFAPEMLLEQP